MQFVATGVKEAKDVFDYCYIKIDDKMYQIVEFTTETETTTIWTILSIDTHKQTEISLPLDFKLLVYKPL